MICVVYRVMFLSREGSWELITLEIIITRPPKKSSNYLGCHTDSWSVNASINIAKTYQPSCCFRDTSPYHVWKQLNWPSLPPVWFLLMCSRVASWALIYLLKYQWKGISDLSFQLIDPIIQLYFLISDASSVITGCGLFIFHCRIHCREHSIKSGTYKTQELPCGIRVAGNP